MKINRDLLTEFVARYPAQPATAFWRAIEIDVLSRVPIPSGLGLDLGCGDGILTDILFKRIGETPRLVGVDPDPLETRAAQKFKFYARIHTTRGDAIPEANATFDYAISNSVLEHIQEIEPVVREVGRVLKPGGRFFFTVPSPAFHENLAGALFPGVSRHEYLAQIDKRLAHFNYLSREEWVQLLDRCGLHVSEITGYLGKAATQRWETLSRYTGGLLHSLSFGTRRPIEIQRTFRIRDVQNAVSLPHGLAAGVASLIARGLNWEDDETNASCFLITGERTCGF